MVEIKPSPVKALVVGYGSIGRRHARILGEMGCRVAVVSRRSISFNPQYSDLSEAFSKWQPEYVVVADRTMDHRETIETIARCGFKGCLLVEKPLYDTYGAFPTRAFSHVAVGYNLRFHPLMVKLKHCVDQATKIVSAHIYVGTYLPDWRPNRDYRDSYSAKKREGGGILRDLSHELDYVLWMFGPWTRLTAMGGHLSPLDIDSDDAYCILMETPRCPMVSINMNWYDKSERREITVITDTHPVIVDLVGSTIRIGEEMEIVEGKRDDTFRSEHMSMLGSGGGGLCGLKEALETLFTIESAEKAAASQEWIKR